MANEFNIKRGFISNGDSTVNGLLTSQSLKITSGATNGYVLTSDASGNASWVAPTTDTNIYNTNGTLTNSRTVDLAGNSISFVDGFATSTFLFNSDDGNDAATISASIGSILLGASGGGTGKALNITTTQISLDGKFTVDATKNTSGQNLEVNGQTKTTTFQMTTSPTAGYVLTSDASGNGTWQPSTITTVSANTSTIHFTGNTIFGSFSSPLSTNISDNLTGAKLGITQKIYHNSGSVPTVPAGWVLLGSTTYQISTTNIIYAEWSEGTRVEYWIVR